MSWFLRERSTSRESRKAAALIFGLIQKHPFIDDPFAQRLHIFDCDCLVYLGGSSVSSPIRSGKTTARICGCKFKSEKMKLAPSSYYSDMLHIGHETLTGQY